MMRRVLAVLRLLGAALRDAWRAFLERMASHVPTMWLLTSLLLLPSYDLFNVETALYDAQVKSKYLLGNAPPRPAPSIVVVAIDDASRRADPLGRLNRTQPMSRAYLAEVVDRIAAMAPSVIALDIFLDLPADNRSDDVALTAALARARQHGCRIVLAARLTELHGTSVPVLPIDAYLEGVDRVGHASLVATASDKVIRQGLLAQRMLGPADLWLVEPAGLLPYLGRPALFDSSHEASGEVFWFWSLAGAAVLAQADPPAASRLRAWRKEPAFLIDFALAPNAAFSQISASTMLAGSAPAAEVQGAIVILGVAFDGSEDRHETPLSGSGSHGGRWSLRAVLDKGMHGVQVQAYAMRSLAGALAGNRLARPVSEAWLTTWAFAAGLLLSLAVHRGIQEVRLAPVVASALVYVLICVCLYQFIGTYLPISRATVAFALAYGLVPLMKRTLRPPAARN